MKLIWKLLKQNISITELAVFFVTNLIGVVIILCGVQAYSDVKPMLSGEKSLIGNDYMIISKPVKRVGINATKFDADEIEAIANMEFVESLGEFSSSQYEVYGSVMFSGRKLSTMMFFEAVPDEFIDVETEAWAFDSAKREIPIIIPRNYLNLYNFGFSNTQGLPQITESLIKSVELGVRLTGNGHREEYSGRVVGFSDRLNTILVPMDFMQWANERFAGTTEREVSRLILEVANPGDPKVVEYLTENGYVSEERPAESSKALFLLKVAVAVVVIIGLIFSILSIVILTLSIYLIIQKNIDKLENLNLIGYTPHQIARPYNMIVLVMNLAILALGIIATAVIQSLYSDYLASLADAELHTTLWPAIVSGTAICVAVTLFNLYIIQHKIAYIARKR